MDLAHAMSRLPSLDVRFCVLGPRPGNEPVRARRLGVSYLEVDEPASSVRGLLRAARLLRRRLKEWSVDVVHSHLLPADLVAALAASFSKVRHFAHIRDLSASLVSGRLQDRIRRQIHRATYSVAGTRFVAVSHDAADYNGRALKIEPSRMHVVVDGIDLARIPDNRPANRATGRFRVGCAGRLVREKGHAFVIAAIAEIARTGRDVEFHLAGSGSLEADLRRQAQELGVATRVNILREVDDMAGFYRSLDAFILPTLATEGLPLVVMEAMAAGCAVISTKTTGISDIITHEREGLLVEARSSSAIAHAILCLMRDDDFRSRLARAGEQRVRADHTIERVAHEIGGLYEQTA